ncbi:subtilisin-like protein [Roridomyces roridus]|uniref:tripeptidyl-peptidase II n=1 Tax=Roridomyces roridus TaxID=1738132 RepID=A0AAD7BGT2_9AGAR|nr:subtilisin-like protein [Roridomyces roridus]
MAPFLFLHLLTLVALVSARSLIVHDSRPDAPEGYVHHGAAPEDQQLTLRFALAGKNTSGLHDTLKAISTPGSASFRRWLSADEVKSFVEPSSATLAAFHSFASANGISASSASPHGDWVSITVPVSKANALFQAQYQTYSHPSLAKPVTRTLSISLPVELAGHVDAIFPSTSFSNPRTPHAAPSELGTKGKPSFTSCDSSDPHGVMTPNCLQALYGIPLTPASRQDNRILVTGYGARSPSRESLAEFLTEYRPDISNKTGFNLIRLGNGTFTSTGLFDITTFETDIDIQHTVGIATGVPVEFLSVGKDNADAFLDTITFVEGLQDPPSVMTSSYGFDESSLGATIATKMCNGYAGLAARGITVLFSSGDGGVRGTHDSGTRCTSNVFVPAFPSSCPWVTTVGGTLGIRPEKAMNLTSGGFSNIFPRPAYQDTAVESFLATVPNAFPAVFNKTGRGYPDVALQANKLAQFSQGSHGTAYGTSLSTPIFASMIALINDRLLAAGEQRLGFLNPWIYQHADAFTDITAGTNPGFVCPASSLAFEARAGWDPLTGVGSPVFSKLLNAAFARY